MRLSKVRIKLLKILLGNEVTIFVEEKGSNCYEAEVADSKNRIKLVTMNLERLSKEV